jgi:penicillin-binding protein 2
MATEVIATDEFADWYDELTAEEQRSVGRVVDLLEERGTALPFPFSSGIKGAQSRSVQSPARRRSRRASSMPPSTLWCWCFPHAADSCWPRECGACRLLGADSYRVLAEANRIRKDPVRAPRGKIFDREGRILVDNYPSVSCYLLREQAKDVQADVPMIARGLIFRSNRSRPHCAATQPHAEVRVHPTEAGHHPGRAGLHRGASQRVPELETRDDQRRLYPRDGFAAHLIGYVGEVSEEDLNSSKFDFYEPGDVVGKSGVEETYDSWLRGTDGSRDVVVNSHGKEVGQPLGQQLAIPGKDLRLTIDLDLQRVAEQAMEGKNGALVAMDPHTGEILAMVSRPAFDPNQFAVRLTKQLLVADRQRPDHPLMNKAIQAQLAPGSTFKIIMSLAGLEEGVAQDMHVMCNGGGTFYGRFFACDKHHGMVDIDHAIPWSCDTFYYTLAEKLGIDTIAKYATEVGSRAEDRHRSARRGLRHHALHGLEVEDTA